MTKTELIQSIQKELNLSETIVHNVVDTAISTIMKKVAENETVSIKNFGTFRAKHRSERKGRNITTGESIIIEAHKVPTFKSGKIFKKLVNQ